MTQARHSDLYPDALVARYHTAQTTLDAPAHVSDGSAAQQALPSAQVRTAILTHAAQVIQAQGFTTKLPNAMYSVAIHADKTRMDNQFESSTVAANDKQWQIRALASIALLGLTGLLFMQWDRGTPDEKDVAFNMEHPAPVSETASVTVPVPTTTATPASVEPVAVATTVATAPKTPVQDVQTPARPVPITPNAAPVVGAPSAPETPAPLPATLPPRPASAHKSMGAIAGAAQQNSHDSPLNAALFSAIHAGDAVSLQLALTRGADKNAKSHGTPAITMCVQAGHLELVRLLAAVEVDMNALDTQGLSPLAHAQARGMQNMQLLLKELGAK